MPRLPSIPSLLRAVSRGPSLFSSTTTITSQPALPRPFTTTPIPLRKEIPHPHRLPQNRKPLPPPEIVTKPPPYPFGPRRLYKQSNRGLYGLSRPQHGNTVAEEYGNKSRRRWKPNVHRKRLYSPILGRWIRVRLTSRVLRTIDKLRSIDEYLLGMTTRRIKELGPHGWKLRWIVMQSHHGRARINQLRRKLGVPSNHGERELELREMVRKMQEERAAAAAAANTAMAAGASAMGVSAVTEAEQEALYEDPALMGEVNHMLDNDHEFELGDPNETVGKEEVGTSRKT